MSDKFSLSTLINLVINYVHTDDVISVLEYAYGSSEPIDDRLERYFTEHSIIKALIEIIDSRRRLLEIAGDVSGDNIIIPKDASREELASIILESLGGPNIPAPEQYKGVWGVYEELSRIEISLMSGDLSQLRTHALNGWTYVEHVIKLTLQFYIEVLGRDMTQRLPQSLKKAIKQKSLGPTLIEMNKIQKKFRDIGVKSESERNRFYFTFGRNTPFEGFDFSKYIDSTGMCRNFFAHSVVESIHREGIPRVKYSVEIARSFIMDLITLNIAPLMIIPTSRGYDVYGRRMIGFIPENIAIKHDWLQPGISDLWMYKDWERDELIFFHPYLGVIWKNTMSNNIMSKEMLCDPFLIDIDRVYAEGEEFQEEESEDEE